MVNGSGDDKTGLSLDVVIDAGDEVEVGCFGGGADDIGSVPVVVSTDVVSHEVVE